jgi:hypothetical protein
MGRGAPAWPRRNRTYEVRCKSMVARAIVGRHAGADWRRQPPHGANPNGCRLQHPQGPGGQGTGHPHSTWSSCCDRRLGPRLSPQARRNCYCSTSLTCHARGPGSARVTCVRSRWTFGRRVNPTDMSARTGGCETLTSCRSATAWRQGHRSTNAIRRGIQAELPPWRTG